MTCTAQQRPCRALRPSPSALHCPSASGAHSHARTPFQCTPPPNPPSLNPPTPSSPPPRRTPPPASWPPTPRSFPLQPPQPILHTQAPHQQQQHFQQQQQPAAAAARWAPSSCLVCTSRWRRASSGACPRCAWACTRGGWAPCGWPPPPCCATRGWRWGGWRWRS